MKNISSVVYLQGKAREALINIHLQSIPGLF